MTPTVELRVLITTERPADEIEAEVRSTLSLIAPPSSCYVEQVLPRHEVRPWIR